MASRYDAIVVGCGAMGSSVSYNLAKRGLRVATFERFGLNHSFGSSHGETRIIRLAYYEDPRYVPLLRRAYELWGELESRSGERLLRRTGGLMVGRPEEELVKGVLASAKEHGIGVRVLTAKSVKDEFAIFSLDEEQVAVHEESAGALFPEECIEAYVTLAKAEGCEFRFGEPVSRWGHSENGVELEAGGSKFGADRIVFCAGAWTRKLLGEIVPLECERQVPFWFSSRGERSFSPDRMPVFILEEDSGRFYYGIPDFGRGVKVARTHGGQLVDPDRVDREVTEKDAAPVEEFVKKRLPRLAVPASGSTTCIYTNTPDLNFAVGIHPEDPRVVIVSACSGHGFKFASVLGEAAAKMVAEGRVPREMGFLGLGRFGRK